MRKLALIVPVLLATAACSNFTWQDQHVNIPDDQLAYGVRDVDTLVREYESAQFYGGVRRRADGVANAFGRDLASIQTTFGRHFLNYSPTDPYVNYKSDTGYLGHLGNFTTTFVTTLVPVR
jgi:hypothetical protein